MDMMEPLFLDWDIGFADWSRRRNNIFGKRSKGWMKNRLRRLDDLLDLGDLRVSYRRSANGRVHVRIHDDGSPPMSFSDSIILRVYLHDDSARVELDIGRYAMGEPTNRLFDTKYKAGKVTHAGPWHPWFSLKIGPKV